MDLELFYTIKGLWLHPEHTQMSDTELRETIVRYALLNFTGTEEERKTRFDQTLGLLQHKGDQ